MLMPYGQRRKKTCLWEFANNKDADMPAHPRNQINIFVFHLLESTLSRLAESEILNFYLVSVVELAGLNLSFSDWSIHVAAQT